MVQPTHSPYNLLMLSGDSSVARGSDGAFYQMLTRFSRYWERIDILTPAAPGAEARTLHDNVFVHPANQHRALQPWFIERKGNELLAARPYHLLTSHDFGFFYNGLGAWRLLRKHAIPLVSEIHHVEGYPLAVSLRERLWRWAAWWYLPWAAKHVTAFRVVNQEVAELLRSLGIPDERILRRSSLYLDVEHYRPLPVEKVYDVLFVGRLASNKGIVLLLDALAIVAQTHPHVRLAIRGDGPLRSVVQRKIAALGLEAQVALLPRVADSEAMPAFYQQARMLVCASTVEGNPRVTVEAMSCGVPVISTRVGIMPELLRDGENGLLVERDPVALAEAIRSLLDDPQAQQRIGMAGRAAVQRFSAETTIADYALAYHALIAAHQP